MPAPRPTKNNIRILCAIVLFISAIAFPWWMTAGIAFIALCISEAEEIIAAGIITDLIFGVSVSGWFFGTWAMTLLFGSSYLVAQLMRFGYRRYIKVRIL